MIIRNPAARSIISHALVGRLFNIQMFGHVANRELLSKLTVFKRTVNLLKKFTVNKIISSSGQSVNSLLPRSLKRPKENVRRKQSKLWCTSTIHLPILKSEAGFGQKPVPHIPYSSDLVP